MKLSSFLSTIEELKSAGLSDNPDIEFSLDDEKVALLDGVWEEFQHRVTGELCGRLKLNLVKKPKTFDDFLGLLMKMAEVRNDPRNLDNLDASSSQPLPGLGDPPQKSIHDLMAAALLGLGGTPPGPCNDPGCCSDPAPPRSILESLTPEQYDAVEEEKRAAQQRRV
jgi:hypothetical protein